MTELLLSPSTVATWSRALAGMPTVGLEQANAVASLQTRRDRKYVVRPDVLHAVVADLPDVGALEVRGRLVHRYRSVYFDTEQLDLYRLAATGHRRRYKVRRREYVDDQLCMLEVKTKDSRGRTAKARTEMIGGDECGLSERELAFVGDTLHAAGIVHTHTSPLRPSVETGYLRTTLVPVREEWRATIDLDLVGAPAGGAPVALGRSVVIETKSNGSPTPLDRALWARGVRPIRVSKFAVAMAITRPGLSANRWNRVLRDHLDWDQLS
ncbi:MAG: VTC domain-containing protein [Actinomycetota bacterium]|nr:VTC domain-containing protein [Actinomycetota bacterium]